ncbi:hypothetical protein LSAT2_006198 [Lamellibrachia satsuma]|nr:hypothetical protein LSAT2_006198 [Lamellibrachia satsuma]
MVNFCGVFACGKRADRDSHLSYYRLPTIRITQGEQTRQLSEERQRAWLSNIGRRDIKPSNYPYTRVCSLHFVNGKPAGLYDKTNCDWAPTVNLGHDKFKPSFGATCSSRYERTVDRAANKSRLDTANTLLSMQSFLVEDLHEIETPAADDDSDSKECQCQTDMNGDALRGMEEEMKRLMLENSSLKVQLASAQLTESSLAGNDNKVNFLTGLPTHHILIQLVNFVSPRQNETHRSSLTKFQQLLMTLIKLRLNVSNELLGFMFNVKQSTVSRTFLNTLDILYIMLQPLIIWPGREDLKKTMPMEFRRYLESKVVVIIDCFE